MIYILLEYWDRKPAQVVMASLNRYPCVMMLANAFPFPDGMPKSTQGETKDCLTAGLVLMEGQIIMNMVIQAQIFVFLK